MKILEYYFLLGCHAAETDGATVNDFVGYDPRGLKGNGMIHPMSAMGGMIERKWSQTQWSRISFAT